MTLVREIYFVDFVDKRLVYCAISFGLLRVATWTSVDSLLSHMAPPPSTCYLGAPRVSCNCGAQRPSQLGLEKISSLSPRCWVFCRLWNLIFEEKLKKKWRNCLKVLFRKLFFIFLKIFSKIIFIIYYYYFLLFLYFL